MSGDPRDPRGLDSLDWESFWDLATPSEAADVLFALYDSGAAKAAADSRAAARADGREDDVRFWDAARDILDRRYPSPPVLVWPR